MESAVVVVSYEGLAVVVVVSDEVIDLAHQFLDRSDATLVAESPCRSSARRIVFIVTIGQWRSCKSE